MMDRHKVLRGVILTPLPQFQWQMWEDGVCILEGERIAFAGSLQEYYRQYGAAPPVPARPRQLILPGLVDLHTHLPQYPVRGMGEGTLLEWLEKWIFPAEAAFQDPTTAARVAQQFFGALLRRGTTAAVVYGPPYAEATALAFAAAREVGIRVWMGMTLMDRNVPAALRRDPEVLVRETEKLIQQWHQPENGLQYVITPRFAPSCSPLLLRACAELAQKWQLKVQTHLAENPAELRWVAQLFPQQPHYTGVYHAFGLLTAETIFAHCIYLREEEVALLRRYDAVIAHCPTSNRFLQSGTMPLQRYLRQQVRIGLGTDIAAGYYLSMVEEARESVEQSKVFSLHVDTTVAVVAPEVALWLATRGGAAALGMESSLGSVLPGYAADIVCFRIPAAWQWQSAAELIRLLLYRSQELTVSAVYVAGRERLQHVAPH